MTKFGELKIGERFRFAGRNTKDVWMKIVLARAGFPIQSIQSVCVSGAPGKNRADETSQGCYFGNERDEMEVVRITEGAGEQKKFADLAVGQCFALTQMPGATLMKTQTSKWYTRDDEEDGMVECGINAVIIKSSVDSYPAGTTLFFKPEHEVMTAESPI